MNSRIKVTRGFNLRLAGAPRQVVSDSPPVTEAALLGTDLPGIRPRFAVAEGDPVAAGDILFTDRARPCIAFAAPIGGRVSRIEYGPRRTLSAVIVTQDDDLAPESRADTVSGDSAEALREALQDRGLWPAFRSRPFGRIPDQEAVPQAIFVTAIDTRPLAADPVAVLADAKDSFAAGLAALTRLTDGPVHVCQAPGPALADAGGQIRVTEFHGPHPAGLAGTHIDRLMRTTATSAVWTINYQDAAAIGTLLATGSYPNLRTVALAGPRAADPRLIRCPLGASLRDLTETAIAGPVAGGRTPARLVSGSVLSGKEAAYLGRYHTQVSVLDAMPGRPASGLLGWLARHRSAGPRPIIPTEALDRAFAFDIPAVPLMRALAIGDAETAQRLGALALVEEDVAVLSCLCTSAADYGALLRRVLDDLADAA